MWLGYTLPLSKQCKYFVITFKAGSKITADINVITEKFFVDHNLKSKSTFCQMKCITLSQKTCTILFVCNNFVKPS